jgi:DNA mismatch repair protein MSH5
MCLLFKSVYLKQIGLIVFLAHIGSFVPCEHAVIGLTDKILTRISSPESVSSMQSSFTTDLTQISKMLNSRTSRSLCLIDEFGKGTNPVDGMALLSSIIEYLTQHKSKAVFVLHFTEILFDQAINPVCMQSINCFRMETLQEADRDDEDPFQSPVPLYKLKFGVSESSEGIACAAKMGVSERVVHRAQVVKDCLTLHRPVEPIKFTTHKLFQKESHKELLRIFLASEDWTKAEDGQVDKLRELL